MKLGSSAGVFNARVQADLFVYKEIWILLIIDEATRYKAASAITSRDFAEITRKMMEHWFMILWSTHAAGDGSGDRDDVT